MDYLEFNITGPVKVTAFRLKYKEKIIAYCYWHGTDTLLHFSPIVPNIKLRVPSEPAFLPGDKLEVENEGFKEVEHIEPVVLKPCIIKSLWLGEIGVSKTGWVGWRYLVKNTQ